MEEQKVKKRWKILFLILGIICLFLLFSFVDILVNKNLTKVNITNNPYEGNLEAKVVIVEYSDFQCSFCQKYWNETYSLIKENYVDTGKVLYVFKNYPLVSLHPRAFTEAVASECAYEQNKFWEYHDALFSLGGQGYEMSDTTLVDIATSLDLNITQFTRCMNNEDTYFKVDNDIGEARDIGVTGTPTFSINGELFVGAQPYSYFEKLIEEKL